MVAQSRDQPHLRLEENCHFHSTESIRLRLDSPLLHNLFAQKIAIGKIVYFEILLFVDKFLNSKHNKISGKSCQIFGLTHEDCKVTIVGQKSDNHIPDP